MENTDSPGGGVGGHSKDIAKEFMDAATLICANTRGSRTLKNIFIAAVVFCKRAEGEMAVAEPRVMLCPKGQKSCQDALIAGAVPSLPPIVHLQLQ